jgi:hypothetical protein
MKLNWNCTVVLFLLFAFGGCQQMQVTQRHKELSTMMELLLGKSKEEVVLALGAPREVATVAGIEIYKYHQSYGSRTQAAVTPNPYLTTGSARSWEAYDTVNAYFKDGVMVKWDGYVQR